MKVFAGVDLGATNVRVALSDGDGNILSKVTEKTIRDGMDGSVVTDQIAKMIRRSVVSIGQGVDDLGAIGIGSIGPLDLREGTVVRAANLPYDTIPLVAPLSIEYGVPVRLLNDCVSAVLGEVTFGKGKDVGNCVYVTISTGIGAGAVVDKHLLIGKEGNAHEVGHMVVDFEGRLSCGCGRRGHWEAYCGGRGIPQYARLIFATAGRTLSFESRLREVCGDGLERLTPESLFELAKVGDELALRIVEAIGEINAIGFANIVSLYDPEQITVGGSIALNNEKLIIDPIRKQVRDYTVNRVPDITITGLGGDVGLYGAIASAIRVHEGS